MTALLWQLISIALIVFACWTIARLLFKERTAQWAGVAMVTAMFTLAGFGNCNLPAGPASACPQCSYGADIAGCLAGDGRKACAGFVLLLGAFLMHPIMAAAGAVVLLFPCAGDVKILSTIEFSRYAKYRKIPVTVAAAIPLWIFEKPSPLWEKALNTRTYYFLYKWTWYEWLGALAPLFLFWLLWRKARQHNQTVLARFALAVFAYGVFQQVFAMAVLAPASLVRLTPFQPMRYLQLVYFFMVLIGGCLLGKYLLKASAWRWALFLLVAMAACLPLNEPNIQPASTLSCRAVSPSNAWLQAFAWVRTNTPTDAYFALDPRYLEAPGEDYHSFRALAERSQLCDAIKDTAVVTQVPELAPRWDREVEAQSGWRNFQLADFERLKHDFGVNWTLVSYPQPKGLDCQWHNDSLAVCRIP